jgi:hypothetical protein
MCATPGSNTCAAIQSKPPSHFRVGWCISPGCSTGGKKSECVYCVFGSRCRGRHGRSWLVVAMTEHVKMSNFKDNWQNLKTDAQISSLKNHE